MHSPVKGMIINGDRTKYISSKFFFTHNLQKNGDINIQQTLLGENLLDLFTKSLPTATKMVYKIGMHWLKILKADHYKKELHFKHKEYYTLFPSLGFFFTDFFLIKF